LIMSTIWIKEANIFILISGKQLKYGNPVMGDQSTMASVNLSGLSIHEFIMYVLRKGRLIENALDNIAHPL